MSIKRHKVIHCFDSLIILLYEHPFTIYFDTHRRPDLNVIDFTYFKYFIDKSIGLDNRLCLYKSSPTTRWNNLNTIYIRHRAIYPSCIHVYMQFILITKHKHMYINSRIIQIKQKRLFPFFFLFFC